MEVYILIGLIFAAFVVLVLSQSGGRTLTGRATVVSRQVEWGSFGGRYSSSWNYLVTFRLSDGEEIKLYTFENEYNTLQEGMTGMLTWHKESMSRFEPDKEV